MKDTQKNIVKEYVSEVIISVQPQKICIQFIGDIIWN